VVAESLLVSAVGGSRARFSSGATAANLGTAKQI